MLPGALVHIAYLTAAALFLLGIKRLGSPATAPSGNRLGALGMLIAVVVTLLDQRILNPGLILFGIAAGSLIGGVLARRIQMTAMPQLVAIFNGFGGGASALIAAAEFFRQAGVPAGGGSGVPAPGFLLTVALGTVIGTLTFSGSVIAFAKLQELMRGRPIIFPLQTPLNYLLLAATAALGGMLLVRPALEIYLPLFILPLLVGVLMVIRIGGADMPVVISLLNSLSGVAAAAAGFVIGNTILIVAGMLVGAAGLILTQIMVKAMNRSLSNVILGGFGAVAGGPAGAATDRVVRSITSEDGATVLGYADSVIFVPGYGLAVAQAQHLVAELGQLLEQRGARVKYAIHPVAGRMPGHMNVLLAEANVPYDKLFDLDDINDEFDRTDVAVVIGANDVVNPDARNNPQSPLYGMPILNADHARSIIVLKRSMNPGFAGVENELFYHEKTMMLFGDARASVEALVREIKQL